MTKADPLLHLKNPVLDAKVGKSASQSTGVGRVQTTQKEKGRQCRGSIDLLLGKIFDLDELESNQELGVRSAHNKSDE